MKKIALATIATLTTLAVLSNNANASSYVMCHFNSFSAQHSSAPYPVTSTHDVSITNAAGSDRKYRVEYRMFIEKKLIHVDSYELTLKAGGTFTESKLVSSPQTFKSPVNLSSSCQTIIFGDDKNDIKGGGSINIT